MRTWTKVRSRTGSGCNMGDIADGLIEDGETAWFLHLAGHCGQDGPCQYCHGEETMKQKAKEAKLKGRTDDYDRKHATDDGFTRPGSVKKSGGGKGRKR